MVVSPMKLSGRRCLCRTCGKYFNSTTAFDRHRFGPNDARRCLTTDEMLARGMVLSALGLWMTEAQDEGRLWPMAGRKRR
jgi:hypothetical protein